MVVRAVLEGPQRLTALMMVRDVVVIVRVRHRGMRMLVLLIPDHLLPRASLLHRHLFTSGYIHGPTIACYRYRPVRRMYASEARRPPAAERRMRRREHRRGASCRQLRRAARGQ